MTINSRTKISPPTADLIRGAQELERTEHGVLPHRLPALALRQSADPQLRLAEAQPSGVRVVFRTTATTIELDTVRSRTTYAGLPARPDGVIELVVDGLLVESITTAGGVTTTVSMATGTATVEEGPVWTSRFTGLAPDEKNVEIWLPHNEITELRELRASAPIHAAEPSGRPVWLHHGSSISHGSNALRPTETWPARAARLGEVELINRGFGGSALLDQFTARALRDTPADLISLKLGINVVNTDLMRLRAFRSALHGFLDTVRDGHPETPLLLISPIFCGIHEDTPGPGAFDTDALAAGELRFRATGDPAAVAAGALTLRVIREEMRRVVAERAETDAHLHYLDGLELFAEADELLHPLPDALHPDAESHVLIGDRFAALAFGPGGALSS